MSLCLCVSSTACWQTNWTCHLKKPRDGSSTLFATLGSMQRLTPNWWDPLSSSMTQFCIKLIYKGFTTQNQCRSRRKVILIAALLWLGRHINFWEVLRYYIYIQLVCLCVCVCVYMYVCVKPLPGPLHEAPCWTCMFWPTHHNRSL